MTIPCKDCIVLARCKQLICPNPPMFVPSTKIVRYLLTDQFVTSVKCDMLIDYCKAGGRDENDALVNIYKVTDFFSQQYEG